MRTVRPCEVSGWPQRAQFDDSEYFDGDHIFSSLELAIVFCGSQFQSFLKEYDSSSWYEHQNEYNFKPTFLFTSESSYSTVQSLRLHRYYHKHRATPLTRLIAITKTNLDSEVGSAKPILTTSQPKISSHSLKTNQSWGHRTLADVWLGACQFSSLSIGITTVLPP